jgi:hypothetical protein
MEVSLTECYLLESRVRYVQDLHQRSLDKRRGYIYTVGCHKYSHRVCAKRHQIARCFNIPAFSSHYFSINISLL